MAKNKDSPLSQSTPNDLPQFPASYDTPGLSYRRYLWTTRMFAVFSACSMMLNITLGMAIVTMMPLKEIRPVLVKLVEDKDVTSVITEISPALGGIDLLTEKLAAQYVKDRHELVRSNDIMAQRWGRPGEIFLMSSEAEYGRFLQSTQPVLQELRQNDVTTEIIIENINVLRKWVKGGTGLYQVGFTMKGRNAQNAVISTRLFTATLETDYVTLKNVPQNMRLFNPTGFQVQTYTLSQRSEQPAIRTP